MKIIIKCLFVSILFWSCSKEGKKNIHNLQNGAYTASISESGELQAMNSRALNLPSIGFRYGWEFKLIHLVENGRIVKQGDVIAKFDQSSVKKVIIELKTKLELEQANYNKTKVSNEIELRKLETALEEEEANFDLKKLEIEKFKFESKQKLRVKELEFEQVKLKLAEAKKRIKLQGIISSNELKIQELKVKQIQNDIENAYAALEKLTVTSPINGIVQIKNNRRTKLKFKVGDELYLGQSFALVPDLKKMKVLTKINELDFKKIQEGQKVKVRLDALPSVSFHGKVKYLGKLSKAKEAESRIKVFDCEIEVDEADPRLKPGMTVSSEIYYADYKNADYVSNDCIYTTNGKSYVYIWENNEPTMYPVNVKAVNSQFSLVETKLKHGQKLIPIQEISKLKS
ncbi:HlyD family secretion protein [Marinifilum caeruleilacunae]|uniref:HlyD family efflux transporter periplasmic adaptor subunit n=1 Tax=Marinifilum caeruleilacunae TaxID=2499076 RepID=A0ABX1WWA4_9BACT|nr:efflux RND transporter periplasmic adaptor subunit [Marinifilum caeruleilacunae]NOU60170.1 HlyD family efflux transporter periplasmic adaptor subunit [Marinifilum caeruleilacunae]